jgi:Ser/Thr protein kinase RdoA (MazF antagonist)
MNLEVLSEYGIDEKKVQAIPFGKGLINHTWKIIDKDKIYILQRINNDVFKNPLDIDHNTRLIGNHLKKYHPEYFFVTPVISLQGETMIHKPGGFFRLFPFVNGSHTIDTVEIAEQAYEAAAQFAKFTRLLSDVDINELKITIPSFHDLDLRYQQFNADSQKRYRQRIKMAGPLIDKVEEYSGIVEEYKKIKSNPEFKLRVTHHDTKISNVLFNKENKALCVIDLDTVMPGYFISDIGDMMRTYLSPANEEESDMSKIEVRDDIFKAIVQGYSDEMKDELTAMEKNSFFYAGKFMTYMQAIRFLGDYLTGDKYYMALYPEHNMIRAKNQMTLLERLIEKSKIEYEESF